MIAAATGFIVYLALAQPAHAHLAGEGTSDGADQGRTIQLYKQPGTDFEGRFMRARRHWSAIPGVPDFEMVHNPARAEVYVYAYTDFVCRGEMRKWAAPAIDTLMITSECHGRLLETVAEHELGHVLDLEHHPCDSGVSVMSACARVSHITLHDRFTLKYG